MKKKKVIILSVLSLLAVALLVIVAANVLIGSSTIKLVITPDGDNAVVATIKGKIDDAAQISLRIQTPEGYSFDTMVDLEDSNKVLRVVRVENNTVVFRAACESGLPETIGSFRFSVFSKESKPNFFVSDISCLDVALNSISVKFSLEK